MRATEINTVLTAAGIYTAENDATVSQTATGFAVVFAANLDISGVTAALARKFGKVKTVRNGQTVTIWN